MTTICSIRKLTTVLLLLTFLGVPPVTAGEAETGASTEIMGRDAQPAPEPLEAAELAELEERSEEPGDQVAGGALNNQQLTYIVIALAAAIIAILAS